MLKITHLTFAYDLLFFSKGTLESISTLLECFEQFSSTSGLVANRRKSEIYFLGVSLEKRREIISQVQLQEGSLPFRYLGAPLNAKRLLMPSKINHWTTKLLSYGGRLQLSKCIVCCSEFSEPTVLLSKKSDESK